MYLTGTDPISGDGKFNYSHLTDDTWSGGNLYEDSPVYAFQCMLQAYLKPNLKKNTNLWRAGRFVCVQEPRHRDSS